jgi:ribonucleotide monophosphatase NagD (HAD superfamily)
MSTLQSLAEPYSTILCDIWGVVHDGGHLLPGAAPRLAEWKAAGKTIILVTNAPRPASTIEAGLDALGLPRTSYDAITSSGEAGIAALVESAPPVGFIGTREDCAGLVEHGVKVVQQDFTEVACAGLERMPAPSVFYRNCLEYGAPRRPVPLPQPRIEKCFIWGGGWDARGRLPIILREWAGG